MKTILIGENPGVSALIENMDPPIKMEMANMMNKGDLIHLGLSKPSLWVKGIGFVLKDGEWVRSIILEYPPHEFEYLGQDVP